MKTPINAKTLKQHFAYSKWYYILLVIGLFFFWNLFYTVTEPRTPDDQKVDIYIYGFAQQEQLETYMEGIHQSKMPEMKEINCLYVTPDESSGPMVLSTHVAAGEGNLFMLPRDLFQSYAAQGMFVSLDDMDGIVDMCEQAGLNIERGWRKNQETGERHLYGIPVNTMKTLGSMVYSSGELYISMRDYNTNPDYSELMLRTILEDAFSEGAETAVEPVPSAEPESQP